MGICSQAFAETVQSYNEALFELCKAKITLDPGFSSEKVYDCKVYKRVCAKHKPNGKLCVFINTLVDTNRSYQYTTRHIVTVATIDRKSVFTIDNDAVKLGGFSSRTAATTINEILKN